MTVTVPVASLKSGQPGLDKNLRKALKESEHKDIVFSLRSYKVEGASVTAEGELNVAGRPRAVVLSSRLESRGGALFLEGAVKTSDDVTVRWRLELAPVKTDSK
jgi:polyisoprenoid-binding protein YceI